MGRGDEGRGWWVERERNPKEKGWMINGFLLVLYDYMKFKRGSDE